MACEALTHSYLFQSPEPPTIYNTKPTKPTFLTEMNRLRAPATAVAEPVKAVFAYNPLHDLESVWWVLVYVLFYNHCNPDGPREYLKERRQTLNKLFNGELDNNQRLPFFKDPNFTNCVCKDLEFLVQPIKSFSQTLQAAYTEAEEAYPTILPIPEKTVHNMCVEIFHRGVVDSAVGKTLVNFKRRKQDVYKTADQKRLSEPESRLVSSKRAR